MHASNEVKIKVLTIVWGFFKPKHKSKIFLKCKTGEKKERNPNIYFLGKF